MKKILVTGGNGRFATALKEINNKYCIKNNPPRFEEMGLSK